MIIICAISYNLADGVIDNFKIILQYSKSYQKY